MILVQLQDLTFLVAIVEEITTLWIIVSRRMDILLTSQLIREVEEVVALIAEVSLEKKNTKACTHCGTIGHIIEDCYK